MHTPFARHAAVLVLASSLSGDAVQVQSEATSDAMTFFVASRGRGFGADFGGLAGADAHCQHLADGVGQGRRTWRAYLSAPAVGGRPAVHARDRIGSGPWVNALGVSVAANVEALHADENGLWVERALNEKGSRVGPDRHDILTGSNPDGTLATGGDTTCAGWTSHGAGRAMVGHHNRSGGGARPGSWNSAHASRGCSQAALRASLGDGLVYCFAVD